MLDLPVRSPPPRLGPAGRAIYTLSQSARIAWFLGQYRLAALRAVHTLRPGDIPPGMPSLGVVFTRVLELIKREAANIENGFYALPGNVLPRPGPLLRLSRRFFADLERVTRRRAQEGGQELFRRRGATAPYPRYYLQNFHYQTDGWLSDESAALYDYQVEVLFYGMADAMRRQALVPLAEHLRTGARDPDKLRFLDVGCGTGRFLDAFKSNWPRVTTLGLDLSPNYLRRARLTLRHRSRVSLVNAAAEAIPVPDSTIDAATCVYVFHELPAKIRRQVAGEMARVLRPGGRLVMVDSLQLGDDPPLDPLLEFFPRAYHEPYFREYVRDDLDRLFSGAGLVSRAHTLALFSKVSVYDKPA